MKRGEWYKIPEKRVELIHSITLEYKDAEGKWHYHDASKKTPIAGRVSARMYKKVGANLVDFYKFIPDFNQEIYYTLSVNWFRRVKETDETSLVGESV